MFKRTVLYAGLRSTLQELSRLVNGRILDIKDRIGGFQRGLVVLQMLDGRFDAAFSSSGYFLVYDKRVGDVVFEREREWTEGEVRRRLRRGRVLEFCLDLDGHVNVELEEPRIRTNPYKRIDRVPVEEYLIDNGAFRRLARTHRNCLWDNVYI